MNTSKIITRNETHIKEYLQQSIAMWDILTTQNKMKSVAYAQVRNSTKNPIPGKGTNCFMCDIGEYLDNKYTNYSICDTCMYLDIWGNGGSCMDSPSPYNEWRISDNKSVNAMKVKEALENALYKLNTL